MKEHLGKPLSMIPNPDQEDPGATQVMADFTSFAAANNDKLAAFVDGILRAYDGSVVGSSPDRSRVSLVSSTRYYRGGKFNDMLDRVWDNYDAIQAIMLPTLGVDRRATYSPFMPVVPEETNPRDKIEVMQVAVELLHDSPMNHCIHYDIYPGYGVTCPIHDGFTKLQWKADWAMRWVYFDVDYEMSGKDLIDSVKASSEICKVLGGTPPLNLTYELFLDEQGAKISKSKGNGFTVNQWFRYGSLGSLMLFMFQDPRKAKKLYREIVPQLEDQYLKLRQKPTVGYDDPHWHFSMEAPAPLTSEISFQLMLNLALVSRASTEKQLLAYLTQSRDIPPGEWQTINSLATHVLQYAADKNLFKRDRREPTDQERAAFKELAVRYSMMLSNMTAEHYQYQVYEVGKAHGFQPLRTWFQALYECLLGSSDGPRFGAFTQAYGLENTIALLRQFEEVES
jgi:lysyl-tRNA synthetase class 1